MTPRRVDITIAVSCEQRRPLVHFVKQAVICHYTQTKHYKLIHTHSSYGITTWTVTPVKIKAAIWNSFTESVVIV